MIARWQATPAQNAQTPLNSDMWRSTDEVTGFGATVHIVRLFGANEAFFR